jgi:hypothetical protein
LRAARRDVGQAAARVVDQQQVDALAFQAVVIVEPVGIDQRDVTFAVLGDDLLGAGLHLLGELGQVGAGLRKGHDVAGGETHAWLPV